MPRKDTQTDLVTLMYVPGHDGQIRRFNFPRLWVHRASIGAAIVAVIVLGLGVDYVRARVQLSELDYLRGETRTQRAQLQEYSEQIAQISQDLKQVAAFDKKLRVITNLDPADPLPLPGIGGVDGELIDPDQISGMTRDRRHKMMVESLGFLQDSAPVQAESLAVLVG